MAQPVRRKIQEAHPDLIKDEPFETLLVDGNSLLFSCFADNKKNSDGVHYGAVYQFLLQLKLIMSKRDFDYIYVFFDSTYSGWQRWNIYHPYKANRDKHYEEYGLSEYMRGLLADERRTLAYFKSKDAQKKAKRVKEDADYAEKIEQEEQLKSKSNKWEEFIDANFDRERDILCRYFNELFIRGNIDETTEGDDQIAYYCLHKQPNEKITIISSDMDISQLLAEDIEIYNQKQGLKKFITINNFAEIFGYDYRNVLVKKIFTGDSSDNIGNIKGLSEDGFFKLMPEAKVREITIEEVKNRAQALINERVENKKKPLAVHENIINGVSNKEYNGDFYEINKKIIDLKQPLLSVDAKSKMDAMMYAPLDPEDRSFKNLYLMIKRDKIEELMGDTKFAEFFRPFLRLTEKEKKRYEDSQKN